MKIQKLALSFALSLFLLFGSFLVNNFANSAQAADECTGGSGINKNCTIEIFVKDNNGALKNNVTVVKWNDPSKENNVKDARGNNNREEWKTGNNLPNGKAVFYNLPQDNKYKVQVMPPSGWECADSSCQSSNIALNGSTKTKRFEFKIKPTGGEPPPDDGNNQCQDNRRVKPKLTAQGDVQKTGNQSGDYFEAKFTFKVANKNPKNAKCGGRDYQLYAQTSGNWGPNPPILEFLSGAQVTDVKPGHPKDQLEVKAKIFNTTPAGTYNFTIKAQDTQDSGETRMSDAVQFKFVMPEHDPDDPPPTDTCDQDSDCSDPTPYCKVSSGVCVECKQNSHCATGETCQNNQCVGEDDLPPGGGNGTIHLRMGLDGIGTTGDRQNPSCKFTTNPPAVKARSVILKVFQGANLVKAYDAKEANYKDYARTENDACPPATPSDNGKFIADFDLPQGFASGNYDIQLSSPNSPNLIQTRRNFTLTAGSSTNVGIDLPAGDIDKDADPELRIDITDWNILKECKNKSGNPASCSINNVNYKTDLNDDGKTDNIDMNLFVREFFYRNE